jgi:hypothetical protein
MDSRFTPRSSHSDDGLAQNLPDPMFEPQPSYNFADSHSEETRSVHPTMGSPYAPNQNQQTFFNPVDGTRLVSRHTPPPPCGTDMMNSSFDPDFSFSANSHQLPHGSGVFGQPLNPVHMWHDQSTSGGGFGAGFPDANSMQQIVQNRRSAKQMYGQITPPDDSVDEFPEPKKATAESAVAEAAERAKTDKSERARNAANQRHAKTKRMRKDSEGSDPVDRDEEDGEGGDKKEKYREKNRLAAAKCRAKKKENIEDIEVKHRKLSAMNSSLKKQVQDLRGELTGLRTHALNHQDCNCQISRYNINQAKRVALGVDASSPSMGFLGGGGSMSFMRSPPGVPGMPSRSNYASPSNFAFASVTTPDDMGELQSQDGSPHFGEYMPTGFGGQAFSQR